MHKILTSGLLALLLLLGGAFPAAALDIHIDNSQDLGGSLALRYLRTDGVWVTKGWVNFGPHSKQTVTLETWEPVFYLHVEVGGGASVELLGGSGCLRAGRGCPAGAWPAGGFHQGGGAGGRSPFHAALLIRAAMAGRAVQ